MKLSEIYTSIQGEGPNVGKPTVFVRFGGCNLRCPGWGEGLLPDGTTVPGCDTIFAVYPQFRMEWEKVTAVEVLDRIPTDVGHVCITGGEPLIQPVGEILEFAELLIQYDYTIDLFTNGSQRLPPWTQYNQVTVVMDYKMPSSGEYGSFNDENWLLLNKKDAIKFVIDPKVGPDRVALDKILNTFDAQAFDGKMYIGPVWGSDASQVAKIAQEKGLMLNIQTHKYIWLPEERKV